MTKWCGKSDIEGKEAVSESTRPLGRDAELDSRRKGRAGALDAVAVRNSLNGLSDGSF